MLWRDQLKAALLSLHFGETSYVELRLQSDTNQDAMELSKEFAAYLESLPPAIEKYVLSLTPHPYWKDLWYRFPRQVWALQEQVRGAKEGSQAVYNAWLPGTATHNLVAGAELVFATPPGSQAQLATAASSKPVPQSINELLSAPYELGVASDDMIRVMDTIRSGVVDTHRNLPFEFEIEIRGSDLQVGGNHAEPACQRLHGVRHAGRCADRCGHGGEPGNHSQRSLRARSKSWCGSLPPMPSRISK